jgi:hypothetical protein
MKMNIEGKEEMITKGVVTMTMKNIMTIGMIVTGIIKKDMTMPGVMKKENRNPGKMKEGKKPMSIGSNLKDKNAIGRKKNNIMRRWKQITDIDNSSKKYIPHRLSHQMIYHFKNKINNEYLFPNFGAYDSRIIFAL